MNQRVKRIAVSFVLACVLGAGAADADVLRLDGPGDVDPWIGASGFSYEGFARAGHLVAGVPTTPVISFIVAFSFLADPATTVLPNAIGGYDFIFGGGLLTVSGGAGIFAEITILPFTAPVTAAIFPQNEGLRPPGSLVADLSYGAYFSVPLGPGVLSPQLAALFGASPRTVGGEVQLVMDDLFPDGDGSVCGPGAAVDPFYYCGAYNDFIAEIELQAVPEPALIGLLAIGVGAVVTRMRRA